MKCRLWVSRFCGNLRKKIFNTLRRLAVQPVATEKFKCKYDNVDYEYEYRFFIARIPMIHGSTKVQSIKAWTDVKLNLKFRESEKVRELGMHRGADAQYQSTEEHAEQRASVEEIDAEERVSQDLAHVEDCGPEEHTEQRRLPWDRSEEPCIRQFTRSGLVWYFPDMSGWTSGPIFSGEVRFFPDIDRGSSGGDFENYAEPTTHVFRCF